MSLIRSAVKSLKCPETGWKTTHFWGPTANWGLVLAACYDMSQKGPEIISTNMTTVMIFYSAAFMRFALRIQPRNLFLFSCHFFNFNVQLVQLGRRLYHDYGQMSPSDFKMSAMGFPVLASFLRHEAGPSTIFFWAPAMKWGLSIANLMDLQRPVDTISVSQQLALCTTGAIWTRFAFVVKPKNYNLASVNLALCLTGGYHLFRKFSSPNI